MRGTRKFNNISYSLGAHHLFSGHWKLTTNFGMAWRAPTCKSELYSNGNELGSGMFVCRGFGHEFRKEVINGYPLSVTVAGSASMRTVICNGCCYIYDEPQKRTLLSFQGHILYSNTGRPRLPGMDFDFHFMPADSWDYHLTASFIRANRTDNRKLSSLYPPFSISTMSFHGTTEPGRISG